MSQREDSERLVQRDADIWYDYCVLSISQRKLAAKYDLSQQQISRILKKQRESLPEVTREQLAQERLEQIREIIAAVMPGALEGRRGSIRSYVELVEREAKIAGYEAPARVEEKNDTTIHYQIEGFDDDDNG